MIWNEEKSEYELTNGNKRHGKPCGGSIYLSSYHSYYEVFKMNINLGEVYGR